MKHDDRKWKIPTNPFLQILTQMSNHINKQRNPIQMEKFPQTFSILYLIRASALGNFCFFFFPFTPRQRGSLLFADFLFCFSLFFCILNRFFVFHFAFFEGSISCVSNFGFPWERTRFTVPLLKRLKPHESFHGLWGPKCWKGGKISERWELDLVGWKRRREKRDKSEWIWEGKEERNE